MKAIVEQGRRPDEIVERVASVREIGRTCGEVAVTGEIVLEVSRDGESHRVDSDRIGDIRAGDVLVVIRNVDQLVGRLLVGRLHVVEDGGIDRFEGARLGCLRHGVEIGRLEVVRVVAVGQRLGGRLTAASATTAASPTTA
jgi:hypothetical protein